MANVHLPKPGLRSPAAMEGNCPSTAFKGPTDFEVLRQRLKVCEYSSPPLTPFQTDCFYPEDTEYLDQAFTNEIEAFKTIEIQPIPSRKLRLDRNYLKRLALLAFGLVCIEVVGVTPPAYQIEGTLQYLIGEARSPRFSRHFNLKTRGCTWSIHVDIRDPVGLAYAEVVYDGASIYAYHRFEDGMTNSGAINKGVASVDEGDAPFENATCANYVWLGLASSCYFQRATNAEVQAPWALAKRGPRMVRGTWEFLGPSPSLPSHASFFWGPGLQPSPFDKGWLGGELRVNSTTNIGGFLIPLEFIYQQFRPKSNAKTPEDLETQFEVRVMVNSIQFGNVGDIEPPQTAGITMIEDRRLAAPEGSPTIVYPSTNTYLAKTPEPAALQRQSQLRAIATARSVGATPPRRNYVFLALLALLGTPIVFVLMRRIRQGSKTKS